MKINTTLMILPCELVNYSKCLMVHKRQAAGRWGSKPYLFARGNLVELTIQCTFIAQIPGAFDFSWANTNFQPAIWLFCLVSLERYHHILSPHTWGDFILLYGKHRLYFQSHNSCDNSPVHQMYINSLKPNFCIISIQLTFSSKPLSPAVRFKVKKSHSEYVTLL